MVDQSGKSGKLFMDKFLIPISLLNGAATQITNWQNSISSYTSTRNIDYLHQANDHADLLLPYFRSYVVPPQKVRRVLEEAFKGYAETINEHAINFRDTAASIASEIDQYRKDSKMIYNNIKKVNTTIEEFEADLFGEEAGDNGIKGRVDAFVKNLEEKSQDINDFYIQTLKGDEENPSLSQAREITLFQFSSQVYIIL